jgi:hypothetical protein
MSDAAARVARRRAMQAAGQCPNRDDTCDCPTYDHRWWRPWVWTLPGDDWAWVFIGSDGDPCSGQLRCCTLAVRIPFADRLLVIAIPPFIHRCPPE